MKSLVARVAIYCNVEIKVDDDFDLNNYDTDSLIDEVFENVSNLYPEEETDCEILSIWDEDLTKCLYMS